MLQKITVYLRNEFLLFWIHCISGKRSYFLFHNFPPFEKSTHFCGIPTTSIDQFFLFFLGLSLVWVQSSWIQFTNSTKPNWLQWMENRFFFLTLDRLDGFMSITNHQFSNGQIIRWVLIRMPKNFDMVIVLSPPPFQLCSPELWRNSSLYLIKNSAVILFFHWIPLQLVLFSRVPFPRFRIACNSFFSFFIVIVLCFHLNCHGLVGIFAGFPRIFSFYSTKNLCLVSRTMAMFRVKTTSVAKITNQLHRPYAYNVRH